MNKSEDDHHLLEYIFSVVNQTFPGSKIVTVSHPFKIQHEKEHTMRMSELFPSKYFSKDDLPEPETFTIDECVREEVKNEEGTELKSVLYFSEPDSKPLILNKTNGETIAKIYGDESDEWVGKPIELFVDENVRFGSKKTGGIRVRQPQSPGNEKEAPF